MKKRILSLLTAIAVIFSMMPAAFAATYAEETAFATTDYMSVTKDESGRTTAFSIDFENGIDPITDAGLDVTRAYSSTSETYLYYINNYGKDEGEWNGALNRAYMYATNDSINYVVKANGNSTNATEIIDDVTGLTQGTDYFTTQAGQLYHNQWTAADGGKLYVNQRPGGAVVSAGSGNAAEFTPNVVAGGKFFPEITAFSGVPHAHTGAAHSKADTAAILAKYSNEFKNSAVKNSIDNLSVTTDPDLKNSSNKVVKLAGAADNSSADFNVIGKENVDLADKVTVFEAKVYIEQDKTITNPTAADNNKKPFTMQITKNLDFHTNYLNKIKYNGVLYNPGTTLNNGLMTSSEALDAVTFHGGKIYLGTVKGTQAGSYTTGKWYTVRYYLDTTNPTPVNAVEVLDANNNLIASARDEVVLGEYGTFGWLAGDDASTVETRKAKYNVFSGFDADATYSVFLRNDTAKYDGASNVDFIGYVDDISFNENDYVAYNNNSREFTQDFEHPDYDVDLEYTKFYQNSSDSIENRHYISNGDTAKAALASNSTFIVQGDLYKNQWTGTNLNKPAGTKGVAAWEDAKNFTTYKSETTALTENFRTGGLAGYTGFTSNIGTMPMITATKDDGKFRGEPPVMFVVDSVDKDLYMAAFAGGGGKDLWFGKEGMDLYGKKSKISFDLRNKYKENSKSIVTLSITKDSGNFKEKIASKTATNATYNLRALLPSPTVAVTDAVTIYGGKAYIGNGIDSTTGAIDANKYICDMTDTGYHTVDVYLDYETNRTAPALTVVVKNSDGSVKAIKKGFLPVSTGSVYTSVHGLKSTGVATVDMLFNSKGVNSKATFSAASADSDGYGVYVAVAANGADTRKYMDNFKFTSYVESDVPDMGVTAAVDEATKTLTASIVSPENITGTLIVAEYAAESKALLQTAQTPVDTAVSNAPKAIFENALTEGARYKVFFWDGFENISPLIAAFEPEFIATEE